MTSVGFGILVHHLGRAEESEEVTVRAKVLRAQGRRVLFACEATCEGRLVGIGIHHRVVLAT